MDYCNFTNKADSYTPKVEFCLKSFVSVAVLECSFGKIFIPVTEISVAKTEISVTGPARLLIYENIKIFTKERMARGNLEN